MQTPKSIRPGICEECHGKGLIKKRYRHLLTESKCPTCNGSGRITKS